MRNSFIAMLMLASPACAQTVMPCGSVVENDAAAYCHGRLAHRRDMDHSTPEAREYARHKCMLEQRLRSGR